MKLNNKTKTALIILVIASIIDMWRGWPWTKSLIKKAKSQWASLASAFSDAEQPAEK